MTKQGRIVVENNMKPNAFVGMIRILSRLLAMVFSGIYLLGILWFYGAQNSRIVQLSVTVMICSVFASIFPRKKLKEKGGNAIALCIVLSILCVIGILSEFLFIYYDVIIGGNQYSALIIHGLFICSLFVMLHEIGMIIIRIIRVKRKPGSE